MLLLFLFKFLYLPFKVIHVNLHLMLKSNMTSYISFKFLNDLFVNHRNSSSFGAFLVVDSISSFFVFNHMEQCVLHTLLYQVFWLNWYATDRGFIASRYRHLTQINTLLVDGISRIYLLVLLIRSLFIIIISLQIFYFQIHNDLDAASYILKDLKPVTKIILLL